jgi:hypothetical protein
MGPINLEALNTQLLGAFFYSSILIYTPVLGLANRITNTFPQKGRVIHNLINIIDLQYLL